LVSDNQDGMQARLGEFLGVNELPLPQIRIFNPADGFKKYEYVGSAKKITVNSLNHFIRDFKEGKLTPFYKSQEIPPEDNSKPLKVIVGKTH